MSVHLYWN